MSQSLCNIHDATRMIMENRRSWGTEEIALEKTGGRILAEDILADRDFPPFDRVTMDGTAISHDAYQKGQSSFPVVSMQAAGDQQEELQDPTTAIEIMTGASLPKGADTVIRYEDLQQEGDQVRITSTIKKGLNVHKKGEDRKKGDTLLPKGTYIRGAELSVLATVGKAMVSVYKLPRTAIVSTGDELVDIDQEPLPHQIRRSNPNLVDEVLTTFGIKGDMIHMGDDLDEVRKTLSHIADNYELVILSGGVSRGKMDHVPDTLEEIGVKKLFHKVAHRPGKPFWVGFSEQTSWFALPGNPVSTYMCAHRYVAPWLNHCMGRPWESPWEAILARDFHFKKDLQYFLQVAISVKNGQLIATPVEGNGPGDFANLTDATAFMELPYDKEDFKAGESYTIWPFNQWIIA